MDNMVLNEAYFGKTKGVLKIEKALGALRRKYMGQYFSKDINLDPGIDDICRAIEDAFGFGLVQFEVCIEAGINAFTMPIGTSVDARGSKYMEVDTTNGYRYNKQANFAALLYITSGLFLNEAFTDAEITAIMLHEIGHNFTTSAIDYNGNLNVLNNVLVGLYTFGVYTVASTNVVKRASINLNNYMAKTFRRLAEVYNSFKSVIGTWSYIIAEYLKFGEFVNGITMPFSTMVTTIASNVWSITMRYALFPTRFLTGYDDERFADSFATMYGYGPEMQTALEKLHDRKYSVYAMDKFISESPLIANYIDLFKLPVLFIIYAFDEHPELPARMKNACTQIEYDLKNHHFRPAMKARIKHDLKVMQANLAKYEKINTDVTENPKAIRDMYYQWLLENFDGDLKHNVFFATKPKEINDSFLSKLRLKKFK